MRIEHVETVHLYFAYPPGRGFTTPAGPVKGRLTTLVRVYTDDGRVGTGSAYAHPGMVQVAVDHLTPFLRGLELAPSGADPLAAFVRGRDPIERVWRFMYLWTRWSGRKGAAIVAIGGIDQALWDLRGQREGKPVWKLLGGERSHCPAYASGMLYSSPEAVAEKAGRLVEQGFRRVKLRIGYGWDYDVAAVVAARRAIGEHNDLLADGTQRFDLATAQRMAHELGAQRVFWFEEPFEPQDLDDYVMLRREGRVPIAAGENEFGFEGFRELIRAGAVDVVQPDASRCGGISEVVKVADLARDAGLCFAPHSWCDPVAVIANAHVVAARANGLTVEVDVTGNRFMEELLAQPLRVRDGLLELGQRPGLGIELDPEAVARFRLASPFELPEGNHCDVLIGPPTVLQPIPPYAPPH